MTNFFSKQLFFFFLTLDTGGKTTEAPSRSEKKLLIGLVVAYITVLVLIAVTFHWISRREKMKAAKGTEFEMDASALCGSAATRLGNISEPEVGITHQAFAEDSESSEWNCPWITGSSCSVFGRYEVLNVGQFISKLSSRIPLKILVDL